MIIEQAILTLLAGTSGVTALVSNRIYYVQAPQKVDTPYIVFFKVSGNRDHTHDGATGLANPRFQVDIFGETYLSVKDVAAQVQAALQGYSGTMGGAGGVAVNGCFYEDENDFYGETTKLYHIAQDYILWHRE